MNSPSPPLNMTITCYEEPLQQMVLLLSVLACCQTLAVVIKSFSNEAILSVICVCQKYEGGKKKLHNAL